MRCSGSTTRTRDRTALLVKRDSMHDSSCFILIPPHCGRSRTSSGGGTPPPFTYLTTGVRGAGHAYVVARVGRAPQQQQQHNTTRRIVAPIIEKNAKLEAVSGAGADIVLFLFIERMLPRYSASFAAACRRGTAAAETLVTLPPQPLLGCRCYSCSAVFICFSVCVRVDALMRIPTFPFYFRGVTCRTWFTSFANTRR